MKKMKACFKIISLWPANENTETGFTSRQKCTREIHCKEAATHKPKISVTVYCFLSRKVVHLEQCKKSHVLCSKFDEYQRYPTCL